MIPIGIVTRNRFDYLAVTLHSLSGTDLSLCSAVTIFDDASDAADALEFLYTNNQVRLAHPAPPGNIGITAELEVLKSVPKQTVGIHNQVRVVRQPAPLGVVAGSLQALRSLKEAHPKARGYVLLQDDVVFNADWLQRLFQTACDDNVDLLAGMRLNRLLDDVPTRGQIFVASGTAQCLFLSPGIMADLSWAAPVTGETGFDDKVFAQAQRAGFAVGILRRFCCQHFGFVSRVRPGRRWRDFSMKGRIGYHAKPPYAMSPVIALPTESF